MVYQFGQRTSAGRFEVTINGAKETRFFVNKCQELTHRKQTFNLWYIGVVATPHHKHRKYIFYNIIPYIAYFSGMLEDFIASPNMIGQS